VFKRSSHNQQSRIERAAEFGHANEHGIDPFAFAQEQDRREARRHELINLKQETELKLSSLKRQISQATALHKAKRVGGVGYAAFEAMRNAEQRTLQELRDIEKELSELKAQKHIAKSQQHKVWIERRHQKRLNFEYVFVAVAKENLARSVYERLATITIHRLGEQYEDMEREEKADHVEKDS
jgi:anaerobic selenocysteine-containing dehydrogenase